MLHINERTIEYGFVFDNLTKLMPKTILDVGTGTTALPHVMQNCGFIVTAIDNFRDYWSKRICNRHFYIIEDDILNPKIDQRFDLITCISVLEHIPESNEAVKSMSNLLTKDGYLVLTFPYNENLYVNNIYTHPDASYGKDAPYICQVYSRSEIDNWLKNSPLELIKQDYWQVFSGRLWTLGERIIPPKRVSIYEPHHLTCVLFKTTQR